MKSNYKRLGDYIQEVKVRNSDLSAKELLGINIDKFFMPSVANINGTDLSAYRVVKKNQFACNRMHVGRDYRIPISLSRRDEPFMVSPAYDVFEIKDTEVLEPEFLMMWFSRAEYDRNAWFYTDADVRGGLPWKAFIDMKFPLLPPSEQKALVAEYKSIKDRIRTNQKFIKKIEETAQAIYREWFVDNKDGNWIPGKLSDLIEIKYGKAYAHLNEGVIPLYGSGGIMSYVDKPLYNKPSVLIPRKGTLNNIVFIDEPFWTVDTMFYSVFLKENIGHYVFYYLKQFDFGNLDQGSAVPSMTTSYLNAMEIDIPSEDILKKFEKNLQSLSDRKKHKVKEIKKLEELRGLLLAKMASA